MAVARHLVAVGRVQGVGFRQFMLQSARELQVTGWVRNRADGSVEAMVSGTAPAPEAMIQRARSGPAHARVTELIVTEAQGTFDCFELRPTV